MFKFLQSSVGARANVPAVTGVMPRVRLRVEPLLSAVTILIAAALSHVLLIPWLGYYWDDWINLWDGLALGRDGMVFQMSWDRAIYAVWHGFVFSFIGDNTVGWHLYFFSLVVAGGWLLVWALRGIWPERRFATTAIGLLYVVYPGFLGQPYAYLYHIHFFALTMGILSVGATVRAVQTSDRRTGIFYTVLALVTAAAYLFLYEIYISFEVLRLLLLAVLVQRQGVRLGRQFLTHLAKRYVPYLLVVLGFAVWRVFFFDSVRDTTDLGFILGQYQGNFVGRLTRIPGELLRDFLDSAVFAWFVPAQARASQTTPQALLISIFVGGLAGVSVLVYERWTRWSSETLIDTRKPAGMRWSVQVTLIGLVAASLGLLPTILSQVNLRLLELTDRFTLTAVVPIAILVTGLVFLCASPQARPWIIAALVGVSVMTHFNNGNYYRNIWQDEMNLWWQMAWRVPALQPGTVLAISAPSDSFYPVEPQEVWAPANLIYAPDAREQPALFGLRLTDDVAAQIVGDQGYTYQVQKTLQFTVDFEQTLILAAPDEDSCLRLIDGARPAELPEDAPAALRWSAPQSDINRIVVDATPPVPRPSIFGDEPPRTWCYYFQKADLARQMSDWETVAALGDEARRNGYRPQDATEWLPFIQGYAGVGRCDEARELSAAVLESLPSTQADVLPSACEV